MKNTWTKWLMIGLVAASIVAFGAMVATTYVFAQGDRVCRDVQVGPLEIGGMTKASAEKALKKMSSDYANEKVTLIALDKRWEGTVGDLGASLDWQKALEDAYSVGRKEGLIDRMLHVLTSTGKNKFVTPHVRLDETQVKNTVSNVAHEINRPHEEARLDLVNGKLTVIPDKWGIKLEEDKAAETITEALRNEKTTIHLDVETDKPAITAEDLSDINTQLAKYTTKFNKWKRGRTQNLTLATESVDGTILKPGETFSLNDTVGERLASRGYKSAPIFVNGQLEPGLGGGVCQVSSTIYNAVLLAGLEVVERSNHSRTVPYVPAGLDATVAYGLRDFRFKNNTDTSLCLLARVTDNKLTVELYGNEKDKKNIKIFTGNKKYWGAGSKTVVDKSLKPGTKKEIDKGASGVAVTVYRKVFDKDGKSVTEQVHRDVYPAQKSIIAVGPEVKPSPSVQAKKNDTPVAKPASSDKKLLTTAEAMERGVN